MLIISTREYGIIPKKEIWFYNGSFVKHSLYTSYCYSVIDPQIKTQHQLNEQTTVIDLTLPTESLFNRISDTFRYHIRKAADMNFTVDFNEKPKVSECKMMIKRFNTFASIKNISPMNIRRILALQSTDNLVISTIKKNNEIVVTHVYLHDGERALLMHTFHEGYSKLSPTQGYANKYLHWLDISTFHKKGFKQYDFGGIATKDLPGITTFKCSFGGKVQDVKSFTFVAPLFRPVFRLLKRNK